MRENLKNSLIVNENALIFEGFLMHNQVRPMKIICSNSFSYCKVYLKKTVAISQMFNHVPSHIHWMHLLNTRICRYTYETPRVIFYDQDRYVRKFFNLEMDSTVLKVRCISNKIWTQITPFFICSA